MDSSDEEAISKNSKNTTEIVCYEKKKDYNAEVNAYRFWIEG